MSGEGFDAPVLVGAFEGWNDAGEAATSLVEHLAAAWDAKQVSMIDPDDYYDFQVNRPLVTQEGEDREIVWPTTRLLLGEPETAGPRLARPGEADDVDPDNPPLGVDSLFPVDTGTAVVAQERRQRQCQQARAEHAQDAAGHH